MKKDAKYWAEQLAAAEQSGDAKLEAQALSELERLSAPGYNYGGTDKFYDTRTGFERGADKVTESIQSAGNSSPILNSLRLFIPGVDAGVNLVKGLSSYLPSATSNVSKAFTGGGSGVKNKYVDDKDIANDNRSAAWNNIGVDALLTAATLAGVNMRTPKVVGQTGKQSVIQNAPKVAGTASSPNASAVTEFSQNYNWQPKRLVGRKQPLLLEENSLLANTRGVDDILDKMYVHGGRGGNIYESQTWLNQAQRAGKVRNNAKGMADLYKDLSSNIDFTHGRVFPSYTYKPTAYLKNLNSYSPMFRGKYADMFTPTGEAVGNTGLRAMQKKFKKGGILYKK